MIEYKLEKNELTADPNDYRAVVVNARVYTEEEFMDRMLESGAGLTRSDILSVRAAYKQTALNIIKEGSLINDDLFNMSFTMPGKYHPADETEHHALEIHLHPSRELREAAARLKPRRVSASGKEPLITAALDVNSNTADRISGGGICILKGNKIKVTGSHPDVGLYFKEVSGAGVTKFSGPFAENLPSRLMFQAPSLPAGVYRLSIKTQFTSAVKELAVPRVIEYPHDITVV